MSYIFKIIIFGDNELEIERFFKLNGAETRVLKSGFKYRSLYNYKFDYKKGINNDNYEFHLQIHIVPNTNNLDPEKYAKIFSNEFYPGTISYENYLKNPENNWEKSNNEGYLDDLAFSNVQFTIDFICMGANIGIILFDTNRQNKEKYIEVLIIKLNEKIKASSNFSLYLLGMNQSDTELDFSNFCDEMTEKYHFYKKGNEIKYLEIDGEFQNFNGILATIFKDYLGENNNIRVDTFPTFKDYKEAKQKRFSNFETLTKANSLGFNNFKEYNEYEKEKYQEKRTLMGNDYNAKLSNLKDRLLILFSEILPNDEVNYDDVLEILLDESNKYINDQNLENTLKKDIKKILDQFLINNSELVKYITLKRL